jgi:hypothetical protein
MSAYKLPALGMRPVFTALTQASLPISESPKKVEPKANPVNLLLPIAGPVLAHAVNYVPVVAAGKLFPVAHPVVVPVAHPVVVVGGQPKVMVVDPLVRLAPNLVRF